MVVVVWFALASLFLFLLVMQLLLLDVWILLKFDIRKVFLKYLRKASSEVVVLEFVLVLADDRGAEGLVVKFDLRGLGRKVPLLFLSSKYLTTLLTLIVIPRGMAYIL